MDKKDDLWNGHDPADCLIPDCDSCYMTYRYQKFMRED